MGQNQVSGVKVIQNVVKMQYIGWLVHICNAFILDNGFMVIYCIVYLIPPMTLQYKGLNVRFSALNCRLDM